jgi:hypothetical protein
VAGQTESAVSTDLQPAVGLAETSEVARATVAPDREQMAAFGLQDAASPEGNGTICGPTALLLIAATTSAWLSRRRSRRSSDTSTIGFQNSVTHGLFNPRS